MSVDHIFKTMCLGPRVKPRGSSLRCDLPTSDRTPRSGPKARKRECAPALMRGEAKRTDVRAGV